MPDPVIKVVIPALNEQGAIGKVIAEIPTWINQIIVVDNGSTDNTAKVARTAGARVISVPIPGYGRACLAGIAACQPCDIVVFLDGDASDYPEDMPELLQPILQGDADLVIGSRRRGDIEKGALTLPQRFGNALACWLMAKIWGGKFTDLGPFRAIRMDALAALNMSAPTFGWTVEMQVRALKQGLKCAEIPVRYKNRIGKSKISGTVSGVILAGGYILGTIAREAFSGSGAKYEG
ncbi:MAG: glycosyltransferase family 2 protein [Robiginitomaculum sp.]|nr:glycosyltransferase family 2 protein [Robiginitomaculum sp.]